MKEKMKSKFFLYVLMAMALTALSGCLFSPPPTAGTVEQPPIVNNSPINVLRNVERSYNTMDYDLYKSCLSNNYVFYFNPNDVGEIVQGYEIPVTWNRVEDLESAYHMFGQAYSITMSIPTEAVGEPGPSDKTWRADNITISLTLLTSPGNGLRIGAGYCNFEFERYDVNVGTKVEHRWRLSRWWDYTRDA